jgi:hypothetical protein
VRVVIGLYALVEQLAKQCRAAVYVVRAGRPPPVCRRRVARNTRRVPGRPDEALNVCRLSSLALAAQVGSASSASQVWNGSIADEYTSMVFCDSSPASRPSFQLPNRHSSHPTTRLSFSLHIARPLPQLLRSVS